MASEIVLLELKLETIWGLEDKNFNSEIDNLNLWLINNIKTDEKSKKIGNELIDSLEKIYGTQDRRNILDYYRKEVKKKNKVSEDWIQKHEKVNKKRTNTVIKKTKKPV